MQVCLQSMLFFDVIIVISLVYFIHNFTCVQATRSGIESDEVADKLGISAIIVQDLKEYREKNYQFDWYKALQFKGDTGVFLQYTHARICRYTFVL